MSNEITITLTLTREEADSLKAGAVWFGVGNVNSKLTRAIERAESFVDDNDDDDEMPMTQIDCRGCGGSGNRSHKEKRVTLADFMCFTCGGTG